MSRIILVTGGGRSGKSAFAESLLEGASGKVYIATAPCVDGEMRERIRAHRERRDGGGWHTIEEETDLVGALAHAAADGGQAVLIDCLTLWLNNMLYHKSPPPCDDTISNLIAAAQAFQGTVVMVLNEVGLGGVSENALTRRFCDLSGRCGQLVAAAADEVYFVVCGLPMRVK